MLVADALPQSDVLLRAGDADQRLRWQLAGGDDYELCIAVPPAQMAAARAAAAACGVALTDIGVFEDGEGVRVVDADGADVALPRSGWEHFVA